MIKRRGSAEMIPGFYAAIVPTTPPFPYDRKTVGEPVGPSVIFDGGLSEQDRESLYYGEVGLQNGQFVTSGKYGWTMVATAISDRIETARLKAVEVADRVIIPNVRYRRDIGSNLSAGDYAAIKNFDLLDSPISQGLEGRPADFGA
jgi:phosphoribosylamine--glycine ligase